MPHILALGLELANFVLLPNSISQRQHSLQPGFKDLRRLSAWKELLLLLPMCCVLFTLLALL